MIELGKMDLIKLYHYFSFVHTSTPLGMTVLFYVRDDIPIDRPEFPYSVCITMRFLFHM